MNISADNYNPYANTALEYGGETANAFGTGNYFYYNQHLIFDASTNLVIVAILSPILGAIAIA